MTSHQSDQPRLLNAPSDDAMIWAFYKPSGWAPHPAQGSELDLVTWIHEHDELPDQMAPIHRLDKGTSGIILCSPDASVRAQIGRYFAESQVEKQYLALVFGTTHKSGTIKRKLLDARRKKKLDAVTKYQRLESFGSCSYLSVRPRTGRKHQIRRHLQGIGHAIVGDRRYPPRRFSKLPGFPGRLWLHAERLELPDGQVFETGLPAELKTHLELLREMANAKE